MKKIFLMLFACVTMFAFDKSPLIQAIESQDFYTVKKLVREGANVNEQNEIGYTPLLYAAGLDDKNIVVFLVSKGADIHYKHPSGFGILHRAAMSYNIEVLKYVLGLGLDVNDYGSEYCTPLDFALRDNALQEGGSLENAKLLLQNGADKSINALCSGYTPLMVAADDEDAVRLLLEYGADVNIVNRGDKTAYDYAKEQKASKTILSLLYPTATQDKQKSLEQMTRNDGSLKWERKTAKNGDNDYNAKAAEKYCKNLDWAGYGDYRIPNVEEFEQITLKEPIRDYVINGVDGYCIDTKRFPHITPLYFWVRLKNGKLGYYSFLDKTVQESMYGEGMETLYTGAHEECANCNGRAYVMCVRGKK